MDHIEDNANISFADDLRTAIDTLRKGGVILYPTDTVWGLGCDATDSAAVKKIFDIKRRADSKSMLSLVDSEAALERAVDDVPEVAWQLIEAAVDPLTIIYDHPRALAPELLAPDGSAGLRITSERFSSELCRRLRRPVVSTSANISGRPAPRRFADIDPEIIRAADYVVAYRRGDNTEARPSAIIKISAGGEFKIIR